MQQLAELNLRIVGMEHDHRVQQMFPERRDGGEGKTLRNPREFEGEMLRNLLSGGQIENAGQSIFLLEDTPNPGVLLDALQSAFVFQAKARGCAVVPDIDYGVIIFRHWVSGDGVAGSNLHIRLPANKEVVLNQRELN